MSAPAPAPKSSSRGPRTLRYRGQIRWFGGFCLWGGALGMAAAFVVWAATSQLFEMLGIRGADEMIELFAAVLGIPGLVLVLQYLYLFRPLAGTEVQAYTDGLQIVRQGKRPQQIRFEEVTAIRPRMLGNFGGEIVLVLTGGRRVRFNIFLERIEYIVDALVAFNPKLLSRSAHHRLRRQLILGDHWLARFHEGFRGSRRWVTLFRLLALPALALLAIGLRQSTYLVVHVKVYYHARLIFIALLIALGFEFVCQLLATHIINIHMRERLDRRPDDKRRDLRFESSVDGAILPLYTMAVAAFLFLVYAFDLNTLGVVRAQVPFAGTPRPERLWLDRRFNCVACRFPLSRGELVKFDPATGYDQLGLVVAVSGEPTLINRVEKARYLEVGEHVVVPPESVAVQWESPQPRTEIVPAALVHGRVTREFLHLHRAPIPPATFVVHNTPPVAPPVFKPASLAGCSPESLLEIKKELVYAVTTSVEAYKAANYDVCTQTLEGSGQGLVGRLPVCDAFKSAMSEDLATARNIEDPMSRAWFMLSALQGYLPTLDEQTRAIASQQAAPAPLPTPPAPPAPAPEQAPTPVQE